MTVEVGYARILDGETLWLAVPAAPGQTLVVHAPGKEQPLATDHADGLAVTRARLTGLLGDVRRTVLTFTLDGEPLGWGGGPAPGPTRTPTTRDGRWQLRLVAPDGRLHVIAVPAEPTVRVLSVTTDPDGVLLTLETGAGELVAMDDDDQPLGSAPVGADGTVRPDLPLGRLAVRAGAATLPVVRRVRDLKRPNAAVALPHLADERRLQWQPDGRLAIARVEP